MTSNDSVTRVEVTDKTSFKMIADRPELSVPIILLIVIIIILIMFYVRRIVRSHQHKKSQLEALTSKPSSTQLYAGVRASQTIEFVVPTITLRASEPSFSMTEESDSDWNRTEMGYSSDYSSRSRKRNSKQINESEISKSLYSDTSSRSELDDNPEVNFVLHYSVARQQLLVTLLSARNLPQKRNHLNPFAKVVLMPEKNPKFVTKVQKNNRNPIFNELFVFQAMRDRLDNRVLKISVYNSDSFGRKSVIGRTVFPLKTADITREVTKDVVTDDISCLLIKFQPSGELLLSLTYDTASSTLTLATLTARNIFDREVQQIYMKVVLFVKRKRIRSRKTTSHKVENEIQFDDKFQIFVAEKDLNDVSFSISIYGKSSAFTNKHLLGRTQVGRSCQSAVGRDQWTEMKNNLNQSATHWHIFS